MRLDRMRFDELCPSCRATVDKPTAREAVARHQPGDQIERYVLEKLLGVGGMGEVWSAEQKQPLHRKVALKIIKAGQKAQPVLDRFKAEQQALAEVEHPNIARIYDAG